MFYVFLLQLLWDKLKVLNSGARLVLTSVSSRMLVAHWQTSSTTPGTPYPSSNKNALSSHGLAIRFGVIMDGLNHLICTVVPCIGVFLLG